MKTEDKRKKLNHVCCPVCGNLLFTGDSPGLVTKCDVCKHFICCFTIGEKVTTFPSRRKNERRVHT